MGPRNRTTIAVACAVLHLATFHALAGGWRMYRGGLGRTSVTAEKLTFPLAATWVYEPRHSPSPAWPEPGKELHRMDFDYAFHPVSADGFVYFGSSSDDTVRALEADTGKEVWRFTTGGPVRFAPALANGKVYVASDDGHVTCLDARTGALGWRFRAAPRDGLILGNGRMISRWPLRSGVLVEDGVVYVTAGMWPTRGIFVYALEAETGKQLWSNDGTGGTYINLPHVVSSGFSGVAPQGYLALSGDVLLVPTGRSVPAAFDRHTGRLLHYTPYTHGHTKHGAASITAVGDLYFHREESSLNLVPEHVGEAQPCSRNHMTAYELASGKISIRLLGVYDLLASDDVLYAVGNNKLVALDLAWLRNANKPYYKCLDYPAGHEAVRWTTPQPRVYSLALTGRALVIGGADTIRALGTETGRELWSATVEGQVRGLAVADGRLIAATDKGTLTCFEHAAEPSGPASRNRERSGEPSGIAEQYTAAAARILEATGVARGYALIVGEGDTRLAAALAAQTDLHVVVAFSPGADPARERERLLAAGLLGGRVVVHALDGQASLPFPHYFANLVIVTGGVENTPGEGIYRCLRPCGGVLHFSGSGKEKAKQLVAAARIPQQEISGDGHTIRRGALPGAGEWRYQWADGGRTGVGKESRVRLPFDILWFGGPGPDRMMDRHYASSPPLAVNGRVFVTGRHHVIAMDAYNGCELWCRDLPDAGRRYAQYFSGNFAADGDSLFVATDRRCHRLDQATGKTTHVYQVPESLARDVSAESPNAADDAAPVPPELKERAWGYTSVTENMVIGSYTGPVTNTHKPWVSQGESTAVFALDKNGGSLLWIYRAKRKIGNTKIAFGEGKLFLLDATSYADIYAARRRNETYATEQTLIALDLATGRELWKQQDVPSLQPPRTYDPNGKHARYDKSLQMPYRGWTPYVGHLQYSNGLVVVSASAAYEAAGGRKLWEAKTSLGKTPIIHGDWLIAGGLATHLRTRQPRRIVNVLTGEKSKWQFSQAYGCGSTVGCENILYFRSGAAGFYDFAAGGTTTFGGVKSSCSMSMVAAHGLMILPEGSSGCACSYNFQTSLALLPVADDRDTWYVFPNLYSTGAFKHIRANLGAPGDRRDQDANGWLGFPRPTMDRACRLPLIAESQDTYYRPPSSVDVKRTERPWLYTSGLRGEGRIGVDLGPRRYVCVPACERPPAVDGVLNDACWQGAEPISFAYEAHLFSPDARLLIRRDSKALYVGFQRRAAMRDGKPLPFTAGQTGEDAECWQDDGFDLFIASADMKKGVHLGVSCAGGRSDGICVPAWGIVKPKWDGEWELAAQRTPDAWTAEVAVPFEVLKTVGIEPDKLRLNCIARNQSGQGVEEIFLTNPGSALRRCKAFLPVVDEPVLEKERLFTVRLHFSEPRNTSAGRRVFDVTLQDERVLKDFDILREAGSPNTAVVKEFRRVAGSNSITIGLRSKPSAVTTAAPIINGIEVIEETEP